jgi:hypothetical protein
MVPSRPGDCHGERPRPRAGRSDTDPRVEAILIAAYRRMSSGEKLRQVLECNAAADAMALAGLRFRHRDASEAELRRRLAALRLGERLMVEVLGPDWLRDVRGG